LSTPPPVPPDRPQPATQDDIRSLRRWLLVAGVWAAAATAIAVIALVQATQDDSKEITAQTASQIERVQRDINQRLDDIEERLGDLAPAEDVTRLDNRLKKVENAAGKNGDRLETIADDVNDLQTRVEELEQQAAETPEPEADAGADTEAP
jgi:septal ring factor EnvC (AmiA/AmiB activator)